MLFIGTFKVKEGKSVTLDAYLARRTQGAGLGNAPTEGRFDGIDIVGEYWVQSNDPRIVLIFEADENGPIRAVLVCEDGNGCGTDSTADAAEPALNQI